MHYEWRYTPCRWVKRGGWMTLGPIVLHWDCPRPRHLDRIPELAQGRWRIGAWSFKLSRNRHGVVVQRTKPAPQPPQEAAQ